MFEVIALMLLSHQPVQPMVVGEASYYTVASSSSMTASGETMRNDALTCAMLTGEFGDYVLVVAENGRSVVCRLNDRGPYIEGRVIDLSLAAMRKLCPSSGTMKVTVYNLGKKPPSKVPLRP